MDLSAESSKVDVLMCVGSRDVDGLFMDSLRSCSKYFPLLSHLYIVTSSKNLVQEKIKSLEIHKNITVLADEEVLDPFLHQEDGWYKQQIIKLEAFKVCKTRFVACLSSDTLLLQTVGRENLFSSSGLPILYHRNYDNPSPHYDYEKLRMQAIEKILQMPLQRSGELIDFILDFTLWDTQVLEMLKQYLIGLYGAQVFKMISPGKCYNLAGKRKFGEWSLYAAFVLDVLQAKVEVKGFDEDYFFQVHSQKELNRFEYNSKIVHFVSKDLILK